MTFSPFSLAEKGEYYLLLSVIHLSNSSFNPSVSLVIVSLLRYSKMVVSKVLKMDKSFCSVCTWNVFLNAYFCLVSMEKVPGFGFNIA